MASLKYYTYEMTNGAETVLLMANSPSVEALARDADAKNRAAKDGFKVKADSLVEHAGPVEAQAFVAEYRKKLGKTPEPTSAEYAERAQRVFGKVESKIAPVKPPEDEDE